MILSLRVCSLLSILFVLSFCQVQAQTELRRFKVSPIESPRNLAVFADYPDKAAVIFETTVTNLRFDSQMNGIVEIRDGSSTGKYVLIIDPITQILTISASGFVQESIRIGNPKARDVLYYKIEPERSVSSIIFVKFIIKPEDANVYLNGNLIDIKNTIPLQMGDYKLKLVKEGFKTLENTITINPNNILQSFEMEPIRMESVQLNSIAGVEVKIDNKIEGITDRDGVLKFSLNPGAYLLELNKPGYLSLTQNIDVKEGGQNQFNFNLLSIIGTLSLNIKPSSAKVFINRLEQPDLLRDFRLLEGKYALEIQSEGYEPFFEEIQINREEILVKDIVLKSQLAYKEPLNNALYEKNDVKARFVITLGSQMLDSEAYKLNHNKDGLMHGITLSIQRSLFASVFFSMGLGAQGIQTNQFGPKGILSYVHGHGSLGIRGISFLKLATNAHINVGSFFIKDTDLEIIRKQQFINAGVGLRLPLSRTLGLSGSYALYSSPNVKSIIGVGISWEFGL